MAESPKITDLDILKPPPKYVKLGGKEIDISFIPSGIAFVVLQKQDKLLKLQRKANKSPGNDGVLKEIWDITVDICSEVTAVQYPEMDKKWLREKTNIQQLTALIRMVIDSVMKSTKTVEFEGEEAELKNVSRAANQKSS